MNTISNIALYIGGTRTRHGGFGYITSVGVLAGNEIERDLDRSPASRAVTDENPVITLKNADGYVYYKLWDSSIAPADDVNKPGRLAIGITMPSNARLKDDKSPYSLLMELYKKFLEKGTVKTEDGCTIFRDQDLDKADFVQIIERYPFEMVPFKTEVMKGEMIGELQVPQDKMEEFFRDAQYPEFVNYKAVEVTTKGRNMFPILQIPRPISYEVCINGQSTGKFLLNLDERFNARLDAAEDIKYSALSFSLEELFRNSSHIKQNQNGTAIIKLDKNLRRIECTLKPIPITYKKQVNYTSESDAEAITFFKKGLENGTISIRLDGADWNGPIKPSYAKDAINRNAIDIYPNEAGGYRYSLSKAAIDGFNEAVVLTVKATRARQSKAVHRVGEGGGNRKFFIGLLVGLAAGLLLGVGGALLSQHLHKKKAEKAKVAEQKTAEQKAYQEAYALPSRTEGVKIEEQKEDYLSLLKSEDGSLKYRNYLKTYTKDNGNYSEEDFNSITKRLNEFKEDSLAYANYRMEKERELQELLHKADEAFQNIQTTNEPKRNSKNQIIGAVDYKKVANLCNEYLENFSDLIEENTVKVNDILNTANEKLGKQRSADNGKQKLEKEALVYLNNHDYNGFDKWKEKNNLDNSQRLAIAWILDYKVCVASDKKMTQVEKNAVIKGIKDLIEAKGYDTKAFNDWAEVMRLKKEIDDIVTKKGL